MAPSADHTLVQPDYATKPVTYLRDVMIKAISFVPRGANGKRWLLFKNEEGTGTVSEDGTELVEYSELIKQYDPASNDWEVAYIVIAEPGDVDKQKDVWDEAEIKKACHEFIPGGGLLNFNHDTMDSVGSLVENATALVDFDIETPDGPVTIKKGSWYIGVKPNPDIKAAIQRGEIGGMSVQGSAQREEVQGEVAKADKSDQAIAVGTTGDGVSKLQNILGVEETGKYNDVTESALIEWMKGRGVPGLPTIATVKLVLTDAATPAVTPSATVGAPVEGGDSVAMKQDEPYNPASGDNVPPRPVGTPGINAETVNPDSTTEDLKALIAQSIREGNEGLTKYMSDKYGGSAVGDLYGQDISHEDLWFLISKFIHGNTPSIDINGDYETRSPEVEKGAWTGSHGGHDPDAHKGGAQNFVRTFGKWARGDVDVAARKLLKHGVVKTKQAAYRLAAWLKDQWKGSTDWREGNAANLHKSDVDGLRELLEAEGEDAEEVVRKMTNPEFLNVLGTEDDEADEVTKSPDALGRITEALKQAGEDPAAAVAHIKAILAGPQETEKAEDPAIAALKSALTSAVAEEDPAARAAAVDQIVQEFARYKGRKADPKDSTAAAADSEPTSPGFSGAPKAHAPTFLNKGEDMDRTLIDDETAGRIAQAAQFITSALGGGSADVEDAPAEVEKDGVPPQLQGKKAPQFTADDGGPKGPATADKPTDSPEKEGDLEDTLDDEGEDVSESELLDVMNHLVDEVDAIRADVTALQQLDSKLDKVGDLAKALTVSDDVTEQVTKFASELTAISKSVSEVATQDEVETLRKSLDSVAARLDGIAKTPNRSGAIPVDAPKVSAPAPQAVAKAATDFENPWADPTSNPFR